MTIATPFWTLTPAAAGHMQEIGVDAREVIAVLENPQLRMPAGDQQERLNGFGLTIIVTGSRVISVGLDGADQDNWQDWAVERALFGDGANVPEQTQATLRLETAKPAIAPVPQQIPGAVRFKRRQTVALPAARCGRVETTHVLDGVHPALREAITNQVEGDFSRLLVHSPTRVEILPKR